HRASVVLLGCREAGLNWLLWENFPGCRFPRPGARRQLCGKILPRRADKPGCRNFSATKKENLMDIAGISRSVPDLHAPAPVTPVDRAAGAREVIMAVKALNGAEMFG